MSRLFVEIYCNRNGFQPSDGLDQIALPSTQERWPPPNSDGLRLREHLFSYCSYSYHLTLVYKLILSSYSPPTAAVFFAPRQLPPSFDSEILCLLWVSRCIPSPDPNIWLK